MLYLQASRAAIKRFMHSHNVHTNWRVVNYDTGKPSDLSLRAEGFVLSRKLKDTELKTSVRESAGLLSALYAFIKPAIAILFYSGAST